MSKGDEKPNLWASIGLAFGGFVAFVGIFNEQALPALKNFLSALLGQELSDGSAIRTATFIALIAVLIWLFWNWLSNNRTFQDWRNRETFRSLSEVEEFVGATCAGVLPGHVSYQHGANSPKSLMSESCQKAGHSIVQSLNADDKIVLVCGDFPHQGKSTIAYLLARQRSDVGQKVLLVDADIRDPSQHELCNISNFYGLTHLIDSGEEKRHQFSETFHFLNAGQEPSDPANYILRFLSNRTVLEQWCIEYDLVIIDSPGNARTAVDVQSLATISDYVLYVTTWSNFYGAIVRERLQELSKFTKGQVEFLINRFPMGAAGTSGVLADYWYGYGYGYGYVGSGDDQDQDGSSRDPSGWYSSSFSEASVQVLRHRNLFFRWRWWILGVMGLTAVLWVVSSILSTPTLEQLTERRHVVIDGDGDKVLILESYIGEADSLTELQEDVERQLRFAAQSWQATSVKEFKSVDIVRFDFLFRGPEAQWEFDRYGYPLFAKQFAIGFSDDDLTRANLGPDGLSGRQLISLGKFVPSGDNQAYLRGLCEQREDTAGKFYLCSTNVESRVVESE